MQEGGAGRRRVVIAEEWFSGAAAVRRERATWERVAWVDPRGEQKTRGRRARTNARVKVRVRPSFVTRLMCSPA